MADITATRTTADTTTETREKRDVSELLFAFAPSGLFSLKGGTVPGVEGKRKQVPGILKTKTTTTKKFEWFEKDEIDNSVQINGAIGSTANSPQTVVFDSTATMRAGDVFFNSTKSTRELFFVRSITDGTDAVCFRNIAATATAIDDNDVFIRVGHADKEAGSKRTVRSREADNKFNFTQIMKTTLSISRTDIDQATFAGKNLPEMRGEIMQQHSGDIERTLLLGRRSGPSDNPTTDTNSNEVRTTGGLLHFITTNAYDATSGGYSIASGFAGGSGHNTNLSADEFINEFIPQVDRFNSNDGPEAKDMFLLAPNPYLIAFSEFAKQGGIQVFTGDQSFGVRINTLITPFKNIKLMRSGALEELARDTAFLIHPENLVYRPFTNADTKLQTNIHANDFDGIEDQLMTEYGLQVTAEKTHGIVTGVTSIDV